MSDFAYVSQVTTEVLRIDNPKVRVSQVTTEVLRQTTPAARISQVAIEVLRAADQTQTLSVTVGNGANVDQTRRVVGDRGLVVANAFTAGQTVLLPTHVILVEMMQGCTVQHLAFVNSPRVLSVTSQMFAEQTVVGINATFYVSITSGANVTSIVKGRNTTFTVSVHNTFTADSRFVRRDVIVSISMTSSATVKSRINMTYPISVHSVATVASTFHTTRYIAALLLSDTLVVSDEFDYTREAIHNLKDILTLSESYVRSGEYERDLADYQILTDTFRQAVYIFDDGYTQTFPAGPDQPPVVIPKHPIVTGTPVLSTTRTTITSTEGTLILPAPEYGDTFAAKVQTTIKKSMSGKIYTYVRTNANDKFSLTWILGLKKAYEVRAYFSVALLDPNLPINYFTLYLWSGEIWQAKLTSATLPISQDARWQNSDNLSSEQEKCTVTLEFEGTRFL